MTVPPFDVSCPVCLVKAKRLCRSIRLRKVVEPHEGRWSKSLMQRPSGLLRRAPAGEREP